jgi:hypothetical protein
MCRAKENLLEFLPLLHNTGSSVSEPKAVRQSCLDGPVLTIPHWSPVLAVLSVFFWLYFSGLPVRAFLSRLSCPGCSVLAVLFCLSSCSSCPVLAVPFWLSRSGCLVLVVSFWLYCLIFSFPTVIFWLSSFLFCPGCLILAVICWHPCLDSSWQFFPARSVLPVSIWLPRSGCRVLAFCSGRLLFFFLPWLSFPSIPVLAAIFWQPCPSRPVLEVLSWQSCSACPVLAVLLRLSSPFCPLLTVLPWVSYPGNPVPPFQSCLPCSACPVLSVHFCVSCSACPVLPVLFCLPVLPVLFPVLFWLLFSGCPVLFCPLHFFLPKLSYPSSHVLAVLTWKSCPGSPFLAVFFCLSCSARPGRAVLFCLSGTACPVLPVLFCLPSSACSVLPVLFCLSGSVCPVGYPFFTVWTVYIYVCMCVKRQREDIKKRMPSSVFLRNNSKRLVNKMRRDGVGDSCDALASRPLVPRQLQLRVHRLRYIATV